MVSKLEPYLPNPIGSLVLIRSNLLTKKKLDDNQIKQHNTAVKSVFHALVAVAAYTLSRKSGFSLERAACLLAIPFPEACQIGVATYLMFKGVSNGLDARKTGQTIQAVRYFALAAFAYISTTAKFEEKLDSLNIKMQKFLNEYVDVPLRLSALCVLPVKIGPHYGLAFEQTACLISLIFPNMGRFAVDGNLLIKGVPQALQEVRNGRIAHALKCAILPVFAYLSLTKTFKKTRDVLYANLPFRKSYI
jgi:hypothetical protein